MSGRMGNAAQASVLGLLAQNTAYANVGNTAGLPAAGAVGSLYIALHTADPGAGGTQQTNEAAYTNYARVAVVRSSAGWTITGSSPTTLENAAAIAFNICQLSAPNTETETWFSVGLESSGATPYIWAGPLTAPLIVANGITPSFAINALTCTLD